MPTVGDVGVTGAISGKLYVLTQCYTTLNQEYTPCDPWKFYRYNPVTDRSITLPSPRKEYTIGGVLYDKLYLTNGTTLEVYDPATNQWTSKRPGGGGFGSAAAVLGAKLYVISDITSVYNPLNDTWTAAPPPSFQAYRAATRVFRLGQPRIEVVGGTRPGNNLQYVP